MASPPQRRRAARHRLPVADDATASRRGSSAGRKEPITVAAIVETAFGIVEREGFDALTMRRVATALETGPASLYAHVVNKADLDELLISSICAKIQLPQPNPRKWRAQVVDACTQLRDLYLRYPGISSAALAAAPTNLDSLRVSEGMLGIVLAGGVGPRPAAWAVDALLLYVNAFCLETALRGGPERDEWVVSRLADLPATFPNTKRHAADITSGTPSDRFAFTLNALLDGLVGHGT
jgi:AcrR family transcriptional regulator